MKRMAHVRIVQVRRGIGRDAVTVVYLTKPLGGYLCHEADDLECV